MVGMMLSTQVMAGSAKLHDITIIVNDYTFQSQDIILPTVSIDAGHLVQKKIHPIKITITNKSNHEITLTDRDIVLQVDSQKFLKKINTFSLVQWVYIVGCIFSTGLSIQHISKACRGYSHNSNTSMNHAFRSALWIGVSAILVTAISTISDNQAKEIVKALAEIELRGMVTIEPGQSIEKFIFIDQETYNTFNSCTIPIKKNKQTIIFNLPLD
jgi:hypothetical protein